MMEPMEPDYALVDVDDAEAQHSATRSGKRDKRSPLRTSYIWRQRFVKGGIISTFLLVGIFAAIGFVKKHGDSVCWFRLRVERAYRTPTGSIVSPRTDHNIFSKHRSFRFRLWVPYIIATIASPTISRRRPKASSQKEEDAKKAPSLEGAMNHGRRPFNLYQPGRPVLPSKASLTAQRGKILAFLFITVLYTAFLYHSGGAGSFLDQKGPHDSMLAMASAGRKLTIATWNIAAINNNPFEYWVTIPDNPAYEELMINVEKFLDAPGDKDVSVSNVFTDDMFGELDKQMTDIGWPSVRTYWDDDFKKRKIISGFMKDPLLGSKRLASMPDRVTNTINVDGSPEPVCRPTVINMYGGDLGTLEKWWGEWKTFMFVNPLKIKTKEGIQESIPYQLLQPIKKSKYPDITKEEETVSLPLQTMCGAIFDAILVHMMNTVSTPDVWQPLKSNMVESLNKKKVPHTLEILESTYAESDIITLQEVSSSFIDQAQSGNLGKKFHVVSPRDLDAVRDQNSVIFLNKKTFPDGKIKEITPLVEDSFENADVPVSNGDILAITTKSMDGVPFVVASFHGDTNGLATKPVLDAIVKAMSNDKELDNHQLVFGLDANTYETEKPGKNQGVMDFVSRISHHNLASCWGEKPEIPESYTTYNARTYLQPQLNKACKSTEKRECGDVNPKDFIIFAKDAFSVEKMWKDNTGEKKYIEDMAFPTLTFPSDHGILATVLKPKAS